MLEDLFEFVGQRQQLELVECYSNVRFKVDFGPFKAGEVCEHLDVDLVMGTMFSVVGHRIDKCVRIKLAVEE